MSIETESIEVDRCYDNNKIYYQNLKEIVDFFTHHANLWKLQDWDIDFREDLEERVAECDHDEQTINLSIVYCFLATKESVNDTVLHELAHAITKTDDHNHLWRETAKSMGSTGKVFCSEVFVANYTALCSKCDWVKDIDENPVDSDDEDLPSCPRCLAEAIIVDNTEFISDKLINCWP